MGIQRLSISDERMDLSYFSPGDFLSLTDMDQPAIPPPQKPSWACLQARKYTLIRPILPEPPYPVDRSFEQSPYYYKYVSAETLENGKLSPPIECDKTNNAFVETSPEKSTTDENIASSQKRC